MAIDKTVLCLMGGLSMCAGGAAGKAPVQKPAPKPNVIYFYFDDLGYGDLGCYGQKKIQTPNIDRIAAEGMRFTQHYSSFPVSAPARCGLLTGRHSGHSFVRGNYECGGFTDDTEGGQLALPEGLPTIADLMKRASYTTGCIGKWGLGMINTSGNPQLHGFDYFYGYMDQKQSHNYYPTHLWENGVSVPLDNPYFPVHVQAIPKDSPPEAFDAFIGKDYAVDRMFAKTLEFIRNNRDKAFFLYVPITTPHLSLQCPPQIVAQYVGRFKGEEPYYGQRGYAPCRYPLSTYAAMVTYTDLQVGRIMALLKELGLDDNTIFMVSSDNGATINVGGANTEFFDSTGGLRGRKQDLYEGGISIPFIARWPGHIPVGVSGLPSAQYDMMATLSELTGVKEGSGGDGISMLPTLLGHPEKQKLHEYLYFEFPEQSGQVAVTLGGRWKGVKSNMKSGPGTWEVFDLQSDRAEAVDLSKQHPELIAQFEQIIKKEHWQAEINEWEFINPKSTK